MQYGEGRLVLGDSHASDLFGVLTSRFDSGFLVGLGGSCSPHTDASGRRDDGVTLILEDNLDVSHEIIYQRAGFYLLRGKDGSLGSREMLGGLALTDPVEGITINSGGVEGTLEYLSRLSDYVPVK